MKRWLKMLGGMIGALLVVILIGPLLVPIPPLEGTVPPEQLADPDSRFVEVNGVTVHYKLAGAGEPVFLLLHGFGASVFSWREVMAPLAEHGTVIAFDRPAFGLTERPLPGEWEGESPYSPQVQVALAVGLLDALGFSRAIWVGNSAGGTLATLAALEQPERVEALVLVDAAIYTGGGSAWTRWLFNTPQMEHLGPLIARRIQTWGEDFARSAWHDPTKITPEIWAGYKQPLQVEHWDRALWEFTRASQPLELPARLGELTLPVLVITGDDDRIVPTEQSLRLGAELPNARLVVIPACGHVPHEECPEPFLAAVEAWLATLNHTP